MINGKPISAQSYEQARSKFRKKSSSAFNSYKEDAKELKRKIRAEENAGNFHQADKYRNKLDRLEKNINKAEKAEKEYHENKQKQSNKKGKVKKQTSKKEKVKKQINKKEKAKKLKAASDENNKKPSALKRGKRGGMYYEKKWQENLC